MAGTRKIAAILVADIVGYSRLAGADEDRTLARLRGLRRVALRTGLVSIRPPAVRYQVGKNRYSVNSFGAAAAPRRAVGDGRLRLWGISLRGAPLRTTSRQAESRSQGQ
jgi:hypothetical protein